MKEPNPLAAALADKMWRSGEVPPPGNNPQVLAEALKLNSNRGPQLPRAVKGGLMWGPEWAGLDTPVAETISPLAAAMIERGLGVGQFLPGIGDAIDVRDAFDYAGQAVGAGLEGDWGRLGTAGSLAAIAAMGALPGVDAPNVKQMDEAAQGIRAYHGSPYDFDQFDISRAGSTTDGGQLGRAVYLSTDPRVADIKSKHRYEVEASLSNPLRLEMPDFRTDKTGLITERLGISRDSSPAAITEAAKARGYDGVVLDYAPTGYAGKEIAVFDDKLISILRKYGIAGLLGTSALAAAGAKDTEASEQP